MTFYYVIYWRNALLAVFNDCIWIILRANTRKLNYKMHLQFSKEIIEHGVKFLTTKMSEANVSFRNYKITLKETWDQNFTSVFMAYFCWFDVERVFYKIFFGVFVRFHEVIKLQSFEFSISGIILANVQNIFHWFSLHFYASFMEKKLPIKS